VLRMGDAHARLIQRVLRSTSQRRAKTIQAMTDRVKSELGITTELHAEELLRSVLMDYVYLTGR
ncbi:MAG TPA: hypothetical protein PKG57_09870, partial [Flavobacteriales bacterium]|nr:hypothetical protein [Flavobacteriales bacterium]